MRKILMPLLVAGALPLGGCQYAGLAPALAQVIHEASGGPHYAGDEFVRAAAEGCRGRAARHGRVEVGRVEPQGSNMMRVTGMIEDPYGLRNRNFACLYRSDGRIADFERSVRPDVEVSPSRNDYIRVRGAETGLQYFLVGGSGDDEFVVSSYYSKRYFIDGGKGRDILNLQKLKGTLSDSPRDRQDSIVFGPEMQHAIGVGWVIVTDFETGVAGDTLTITPFLATGEDLATPPVPEPPRDAEARFVAAVLAAAADAPSRRLR